MIHAGAASRIAEMDDMKANIAEAENVLSNRRTVLTRITSRAVKRLLMKR